jgi:hypothetical protein
VPEAEPGQAFRVTVAREPEAEREWAEDEQGALGSLSGGDWSRREFPPIPEPRR